MFTRLSVFDPKANGSCYECALDERHYAQTAQRFACLDRVPHGEHTGAPACLGALAAAQAAIELKRLLAGETTSLAVGCDVIFRAGDYNLTRSAIRRNPQCRFDHQVWEIVPLARSAREVTLGDVFALDAGDGASGGALSVWERLFTTALECRECGRSEATLRLLSRTARMRCRRCGGALAANGFDLRSDLDSAALPAPVLARFLPSFGIRDGDVISVGARHYRIGTGT
jgi:hypothetical protein